MNKIILMIICLLLTLVIEIGVLVLFKEKRKSVYIGCILMNILTNVMLNYLLLYVSKNSQTYITIYIVGEILVFLIEWLIYYILIKQVKISFYYSFYCNLISLTLGIIIFCLINIFYKI